MTSTVYADAPGVLCIDNKQRTRSELIIDCGQEHAHYAHVLYMYLVVMRGVICVACDVTCVLYRVTSRTRLQLECCAVTDEGWSEWQWSRWYQQLIWNPGARARVCT